MAFIPQATGEDDDDEDEKDKAGKLSKNKLRRLARMTVAGVCYEVICERATLNIIKPPSSFFLYQGFSLFCSCPFTFRTEASCGAP